MEQALQGQQLNTPASQGLVRKDAQEVEAPPSMNNIASLASAEDHQDASQSATTAFGVPQALADLKEPEPVLEEQPAPDGNLEEKVLTEQGIVTGDAHAKSNGVVAAPTSKVSEISPPKTGDSATQTDDHPSQMSANPDNAPDDTEKADAASSPKGDLPAAGTVISHEATPQKRKTDDLDDGIAAPEVVEWNGKKQKRKSGIAQKMASAVDKVKERMSPKKGPTVKKPRAPVGKTERTTRSQARAL